MKKTNKILIAIFVLASMFSAIGASADCPVNTTVSGSTANLVGEVTNTGGDTTSLQGWFQYGTVSSQLGTETIHQYLYSATPFCTYVYNLNACTTYYYRAVAQNSAGTTYGDTLSFQTQCLPVTVDLKVNGSDGPVTLNGQSQVTLSWTSQNAGTCYASGDWSGSKAISGSETMNLSTVKTYNFTLACSNSTSSQTGSDSVSVTINAVPPTVITKAAIVTL